MFIRAAAILGVILAWGCLEGSSAHAADANWCKADRVPRIDVKTATDQVTWDFTKSEKQLNSFTIDTKNPYGSSVITDVGGLMQGGIDMSEAMQYGTITHTGLKQVCYWYNSINVTLHIKPTIFIATEFPANTCKHDAIKYHELKHISVDREIVNKYAMLIGEALKQQVNQQSLFGPYEVARGKEVEKYLQNRVETVLRHYNKQMEEERKARQQQVDSLQEYERVNQQCR